MIAVGIPWQHEHIPTRFMLDLLASDLPGDSCVILGNVGDTDSNRNQIVRRALAEGVESIYFLDVDQGIPRDVRKRLGGSGLPIVSALTPHRSGEYVLAYTEYAGKFRPISSFSHEMMKVDGVGLGCVKIDANVFRALQPPWFVNRYSDLGRMEYEHDLAFCIQVRAAGFDIWVDPGCQSSHFATVERKVS